MSHAHTNQHDSKQEQSNKATLSKQQTKNMNRKLKNRSQKQLKSHNQTTQTQTA